MKTKSFDNWEQRKKELKEQYPELTDSDLDYKIGEEEALLKRLQERLNKKEHEIRKWLSWMG